MTISVVIPAWNEETELPATLRRAQSLPGVAEIRVVDAGSTDRTRDIAAASGASVLPGPRHRARQLAIGADGAAGDVLVFLHADTWLPPDATEAVRTALACPGVVGGGFQKRFRNPPLLLRGSRLRTFLFFKATGLLFGDQAIFVRRSVLEAAGGVPQVPIAEEFVLCGRLRPHGRLVLLRQAVLTSARRFQQHGVLRTWVAMLRVLRQYHAGIPLDQIARQYLP